jgi:MFS family permease
MRKAARLSPNSGRADVTRRELHGWLVAAVLCVTLLSVYGSAFGAAGTFLPPLVKEFGWSRARVSSLAAFSSLGSACGFPIAGWLLDRADARLPIVTGAVITGLALLLAGKAHSFETIMLANGVAGVGCGLCTTVPAAAVVANWFKRNRGLAMGFAMTGASLGGMVMVQVASRVTAFAGWRTAYEILGIQIFVVVIPLVLIVVRLRPPEASSAPDSARVETAASNDAGLTLAESTRTRSFWFLLVAEVLWTYVLYAVAVELMIYLIGRGYSSSTAALALSITFGATAIGKFLFGMLADLIGARHAQLIAFVLMATGLTLLLFAHNRAVLVFFLLTYGLAWGSPLALIPLVTADSLGLKHFGAITGTLTAVGIVGAAVGPVMSGFLYDLNKNYMLSFEVCLGFVLISGLLTLGCRPESAEAQRSNEALSVEAV